MTEVMIADEHKAGERELNPKDAAIERVRQKRERLRVLDIRLREIIDERRVLAEELADDKQTAGMPLQDITQEAKVIAGFTDWAEEKGHRRDFALDLSLGLIQGSLERQYAVRQGRLGVTGTARVVEVTDINQRL